MTREEIMALSGRELDAAVAENILGRPVMWRTGPLCSGPYCSINGIHWWPVPYYSDNVLPVIDLHKHMISNFDRLWDYSRELLELLRIPGSKQIDIAMGVLKGLNPEMICRAALLAVAEEGEAQ